MSSISDILQNYALFKSYVSTNVNYKDKDTGDTMLHITQDLEQVKELLNNNANTNIENDKGCTPIFYCDTNEKLKLLLENREQNDFSHEKKEKRMSADSNHQNNEGETLLMTSDIKQTKLLLEYKADPNLQDNYGNMAIHFSNGFRKTKLLLDAGAKCDEIDQYGYYPIYESISINQFMLMFKTNPKLFYSEIDKIYEHIFERQKYRYHSDEIYSQVYEFLHKDLVVEYNVINLDILKLRVENYMKSINGNNHKNNYKK